MILARRFVAAAAVAVLAAAARPALAQYDTTLYSAMRWRMIGPFRGGRTVAAVGVPGKPNVYYVGVNNGGVWRSTDEGRTWVPIFDDQPTGSVGAIAVAPSDPNTIYVGSGEGLQRPDLSTGDGIYKSTDGGKTWAHLGLRDGQQIPALVVDPRDKNRVFAAVLGHPYGPNEERGVFRSTDGGATWQKVLYANENVGAMDVIIDPTNPQTLYADLWESRQGPWENGDFKGPGSGLYKSTDGGTTWRQLTEGLPSSSEGLGRIGIDVARSNPNRLYAVVGAPRRGGIYRSDDAGAHWTRVADDNRLWGRDGDFNEIRADPTNPDVVYVANVVTWKSTDGGKTWAAFRGAPGGDDYHRIWIHPTDPKTMLIAADQGAIVSVNGGETWSSWYNQPTGQMYHVIADNAWPYRVCSGQQESGSACVASRGDDGAITFRDWHPVSVEEYGYVAPDPLDPDIVYGGKITRYDRRTGDVQNIAPKLIRSADYRLLRTAPVLFSPVDPRTLYFASNVLWKTTNGGTSWTQISPDLTRRDSVVPPNIGVYSGTPAARARHPGVIYAVGPSYRSARVIWAGTDDGLVHVTFDGGLHWRDVTPPEVKARPWSKISIIDASHFDTLGAYVAVNTFRLDDLRPHLYRTRDGGKTWTPITDGIPDGGVTNVVREDPKRRGLLYAGTERAVYVSFDDGDHWRPLRLNMPATSIRDLYVKDDDLLAGTHGRSFWILDDVTPLRQMTDAVARADAFLFRPQTAIRWRWSKYPDTPLPPDEPLGQNPPDGAIIDYALGRAASGPLTIEILDAAGKLVRRYASTDTAMPPQDVGNVPRWWIRPTRVPSAEPGMHRFVWDLHYPYPAVSEFSYPISATPYDTPREPRGPWALPGAYTVRLTVNGKSYTQPLTVRMDPRVKTPPAVLARQLALSQRLVALIREDSAALAEVRAMQTRRRADSTTGRAAAPPTPDSLDRKLGTLVGEGAGQGPGAAPPPNLVQLQGDLLALYDAVQGSDAAPTTQLVAAVAEAERKMSALLAQWRGLRGR